VHTDVIFSYVIQLQETTGDRTQMATE